MPIKLVDKTKHGGNWSVHWYGFPELETKAESYNSLLIDILCAIEYDYTYPLLIFPMNGRLAGLEEINHTDTEYLNNVGIAIYMNEPLSLYTTDNTLRAGELDEILSYIQRNNLTNVTVYTCDYRCEEFLTYYTPYMNLLTDDVYIKTLSSPKLTTVQNQFTKRFINLNWRYTEHRHLTAAFMSQLDSHVTWKYIVDDSVLSIYEWSNIKELDNLFNNKVSSGLEHLKKNAPIELDINAPSETIKNINSVHDVKRTSLDQYHGLNVPNHLLEAFYAEAFCDIVTETKYDQLLGNISEKTLRPISYQKPFILVAPPFCLEYLRKLGFKTFSDYWDESYDIETNSQQRLIKIFNVIEYLNEKPINELKQMYSDMHSIIMHNYSLLVEKLPNSTTTERFKSANSRLKNEVWKYKIVQGKDK